MYSLQVEKKIRNILKLRNNKITIDILKIIHGNFNCLPLHEIPNLLSMPRQLIGNS